MSYLSGLGTVTYPAGIFFPVRKKMWSWIRRIAVSWHSSYSFLQDTLCSRPDAISVGEARVWFERSRQFVLLTSAGP